jgi:hypothetical protein
LAGDRVGFGLSFRRNAGIQCNTDVGVRYFHGLSSKQSLWDETTSLDRSRLLGREILSQRCAENRERQFIGANERLLFRAGALRSANQRAHAWSRRGTPRHGQHLHVSSRIEAKPSLRLAPSATFHPYCSGRRLARDNTVSKTMVGKCVRLS